MVAGGLTDDVRRFIREHKLELLAELDGSNEQEPPDPLSDELRELVVLVSRFEGWAWDVPDALRMMRRQVQGDCVPAAELVEAMRLPLETHHAEAWAERQTIQAE